MSTTDAKVVKLPTDFIGKKDESRLESFGGHLIAHGAATRWHWRRSNGIDLEFEIYRGGAEEELLVCIARDRNHDIYLARDASGKEFTQGSLESVMTIVDAIARSARPEPSA